VEFPSEYWSYREVKSKAVAGKNESVKNRREICSVKMKFLPEKSAFDQKIYASSTFTDSRGVPCYKYP
jgi:hypothetical protein